MKPDTIILELENPDVQLDAVKAEFDLKAAEADLTNLRVTLASTTFDKKAAAATVNSDYVQAKLAAIATSSSKRPASFRSHHAAFFHQGRRTGHPQ